MSYDSSTITFRPVEAEDLELIAGWLEMPHVREWWGDPDEELARIRHMVEGRDRTRPFIFSIGGVPTGYIQCWFVGDHQTEAWTRDHPWLAELPAETVGVDLSIADAADLSKGIGSTVLKLFAERLRIEGYRTIIIDPDPNNTRAVRAYEKAGFRPIPALLGRGGDSLIMLYQPDDTPNEAPEAA